MKKLNVVAAIVVMLSVWASAATWTKLAEYTSRLGSHFEVSASSKKSYKITAHDKHVVHHVVMRCSPRTLMDVAKVYNRSKKKAISLQPDQEASTGRVSADGVTFSFLAARTTAPNVFVMISKTKGVDKVSFLFDTDSKEEAKFLKALGARW